MKKTIEPIVRGSQIVGDSQMPKTFAPDMAPKLNRIARPDIGRSYQPKVDAAQNAAPPPPPPPPAKDQ